MDVRPLRYRTKDLARPAGGSKEPKEDNPFLSNYAVVATREANIFQNPKRKSAVLSTLNRNDTISIFGKSGSYLHISAGETFKGFVRERDLRVIN